MEEKRKKRRFKDFFSLSRSVDERSIVMRFRLFWIMYVMLISLTLFPGVLMKMSAEYAEQYGLALKGLAFVFIMAVKWYFDSIKAAGENGHRLRGDYHRFVIMILLFLGMFLLAIAPSFFGSITSAHRSFVKEVSTTLFNALSFGALYFFEIDKTKKEPENPDKNDIA